MTFEVGEEVYYRDRYEEKVYGTVVDRQVVIDRGYDPGYVNDPRKLWARWRHGNYAWMPPELCYRREKVIKYDPTQQGDRDDDI